MDPMTMAAVGAGVSLVSRLIGEAIASGDRERAENLKAAAVAEYGEEILPQLERAEAEQLGATELSKIQLDPAGRNAQISALERLSAYSMPGMTEEDEAEQRRVLDESAGVAGRAAGLAQQSAAARGLSRSGLSQALAAQGAQAAAQTGADATAGLAASRRQRQLQALSMLGQQGSGLRAADYNQAADAASAQDSVNRFNANMRASALAARNQAALDRFNAQMGLKGARNNARLGLANHYSQQADRNSQTAQDIGGGVQGAMQGGANYMEHQDELDRKYGGRK